MMRKKVTQSRKHRAFQSKGGNHRHPTSKHIIIKVPNIQHNEIIFKATKRNRKPHTKEPQEDKQMTYEQKCYQPE